MRYSTYNAIPQYPKSKKHPYENLANCSISHSWDIAVLAAAPHAFLFSAFEVGM